MTNFGDLYSQYYDLLYQDKDYVEEANYVNSLIKKFGKTSNSILDMGCGTGRHAELFFSKGYKVHGIDSSEDMLEVAKNRCNNNGGDLSFSQSSIQDLDLKRKFDVVTSLFHVLSYQNKNEDLIKTFKVAKEHLNDGGVFIFDFWYAPAVLTDTPVVRVKSLENDSVKITRIANPTLSAQENITNVNFNIFIEEKESGRIVKKEEAHAMRYFFDCELEMICTEVGLSVEGKYEWMSQKTPDFGSWNVVWVVRAD